MAMSSECLTLTSIVIQSVKEKPWDTKYWSFTILSGHLYMVKSTCSQSIIGSVLMVQPLIQKSMLIFRLIVTF